MGDGESGAADVGWRHWTLAREAGGIAWLCLDQADSPANKLSAAVLDELWQVLDECERDPPAGLIVASAKGAGFIAGADVEEFTRLESGAEVRELVARGWQLFERLAAQRYPTLALIRGHCMGGGLELSLACRYRIAVDEPGTRLALPEVMLGIVPAWGGMRRLPRTIGPAAALDLMLTGKGVDARKARRLGLVDECVPPRVMDHAARRLLLSGRPPHRPALGQRLLDGPLRRLVAARARRQVARKASYEQYPAPYAIIDIWSRFDGDALAVPPGDPASLESLHASPTARNLIRIFFLQERLKAFGKQHDAGVRRVHVVGAGVMGGDIAAWCALRGLTVSLQDQSLERIAPAVARAATLFARRLRGDPRQVRLALDRLIADPQGHGVDQADLVIEAVVEDLEVKRALFAGLAERARPDAILATNTSSLRIEDIAAALPEPRRLVGIHFFNPVAMLPLVEVVAGAGSDPQVLARAAAFVRAIDKLPLPVRSAPGFLVNAVLGPYMLGALRCVDEGLAAEQVDRALVEFGMPIGPVELADTVGLDVALAAGRVLAGGSGDSPPRRLLELVAAGQLGRKSGQGYYRWAGGKAQKGSAPEVPRGLASRIIEPLLNAARRCVEDGVVEDEDLADAGVIFGTGFAPHTGGPLNLLRQRGPGDGAGPGAGDAGR